MNKNYVLSTAATKMFDETKQDFCQHAFCLRKIKTTLKKIAEKNYCCR